MMMIDLCGFPTCLTASEAADKFMKRPYQFRSILISLAITMFSIAVTAQDKGSVAQPTEPQRSSANNPQDTRNAALRQLGLSNVQVQRIRRLNQERKPLMDDAQRRLRTANRSLDDIIYADVANDADIQARLKEFQLAQAEVAKIRVMNELAVRRILTPEQLVRFRRLRSRFEQNRDRAETRIPDTRQIPVNNLRNTSQAQPLTQKP